MLQPLTVTDVQEEKPGFRTFRFAERLPYEAGQFLTFVQEIGGQQVRRSYSVLSSPALDEPLAIGVRRVDNGVFSRFLFEQVGPGSQLYTTGASGRFLLPQASDGAEIYFFFAAGSGITPVLSLLRTALTAHPHARCVLVYSNHDPETILFRAALESLAEAYGERLHLHLLFSTDPNLRRARLNRELLLALLHEEDALNTSSWFYCCGPENYMRLCRFVLRGAGVPADRIRREDFIPGAPPPLATPPTGPQRVELLRHGQAFTITVEPPDTILRAALKAGIEMPWSCGAGSCGSCVAQCLEGLVWMSNNEVLTDSDLKLGLVLTCTGFPVSGNVRLRV